MFVVPALKNDCSIRPIEQSFDFIPVALMTTFPAQALLGRLGWGFGAAAVGLALLAFLLAVSFWKFGLRFYSGASS